MTIREAIDRANNAKPNQIDEADMVRWLAQLDADIKENIIDIHNYNKDEEEVVLGRFDVNDTSQEMIVPAPYDEVYVDYLKMQIDKANDETARYNNSVTFFNDSYTNFAKWWNKHHIPKGSRTVFGRINYGR